MAGCKTAVIALQFGMCLSVPPLLGSSFSPHTHRTVDETADSSTEYGVPGALLKAVRDAVPVDAAEVRHALTCSQQHLGTVWLIELTHWGPDVEHNVRLREEHLLLNVCCQHCEGLDEREGTRFVCLSVIACNQGKYQTTNVATNPLNSSMLQQAMVLLCMCTKPIPVGQLMCSDITHNLNLAQRRCTTAHADAGNPSLPHKHSCPTDERWVHSTQRPSSSWHAIETNNIPKTPLYVQFRQNLLY